MLLDPPPAVLQAAKPAAARTIETSKICAASRCRDRPELLRASQDRAKTIPARISKNPAGRLVAWNFRNLGTDDSVCGVVAMESVTICETALGVMVAEGENVAAVSGGSVLVTLNVTGLVYIPLADATVRL